MAIDKSFLGTGWSFPPEFNGANRQTNMVSAETDIEESIHILLATTPGERVMDPMYGCGIKAMVFEEINQATITKITHVIQQAILFFEARIDLNSIDIFTDNAMEGRLDIHLDYRVITTNARRNMVYPFYIMEGTLVEL
ncbi:GPW/gp25 family protein [Shewanella sp. VB17]|uniref:GPW/gp25 family protein n=1 Tax=Shewanella sp. VB17 TaxID=2739432 RepID=UPI001563664A|nr:GPW/gp25 family protein [Shewanella sp. VB17]NRD75153.1 GPW/gp25 family protein [Shewanella sp. VB17]